MLDIEENATKLKKRKTKISKNLITKKRKI
jgi:hypothetical protein